MSILVNGSWVKLSIFLNWYSQMSNWITIGFHKKPTSFTLLKVISHFRRNSHSPTVSIFCICFKIFKTSDVVWQFCAILSLPSHRQTNWKKILRFHLPHKMAMYSEWSQIYHAMGNIFPYIYIPEQYFFNSKNECKAIFLVVYRLFKYMFIYRV